jgi:hypothetical protein
MHTEATNTRQVRPARTGSHRHIVKDFASVLILVLKNTAVPSQAQRSSHLAVLRGCRIMDRSGVIQLSIRASRPCRRGQRPLFIRSGRQVVAEPTSSSRPRRGLDGYPTVAARGTKMFWSDGRDLTKRCLVSEKLSPARRMCRGAVQGQTPSPIFGAGALIADAATGLCQPGTVRTTVQARLIVPWAPILGEGDGGWRHQAHQQAVSSWVSYPTHKRNGF